tara:strand:- start:290 stop:958 length:669 start_codon:yes stop_codon:yes gene_type:complete
MKKIYIDNFISTNTEIKSFITTELVEIGKLKKPFFLTIKTKKNLSNNKPRPTFISKYIIFKKKIKNKKSSGIFLHDCKFVKKEFKKQIMNIAKEKTSNSRFVKDKKLPNKFRKNFRALWIENYFKNKRGNYLIVAFKKKIVKGFLLLISNKKNLNIDLIATKKKYQRQGVSKSLIEFAIHKFSKRFNFIVAGTQYDNISAIKLYKKLGFKIKDKHNVYHFHK